MERRSEREVLTSIDEYEQEYGHLDLFRDVDIPTIAHLLDGCDEIEVDAGHTVLEEGASNDSIYVVLAGGLHVRLGAAEAAPLLSLGIGACVGELFTVSATQDGEVDRGNTLRLGGLTQADVVWKATDHFRPFVGGQLSFTWPDVDVAISSEPIDYKGFFGWMAMTGVRLSL